MFKGLKLGLCTVAALSTIAGFSQGLQSEEKSDWKLSIGASYRSFRSVDFKSFQVNGGDYLDGTLKADGTLDLGTIVSGRQTAPFPMPGNTHSAVAVHKASFSGASDELDNALGLSLVLSTPISNESDGLNLDLSFVYVTSDINSSFNAAYSTDNFKSDTGVYMPGSVNWDNGAEVPVRYKMDVALCTLGVGVSQSFDMGAFDMSVGFGPTLTFAYYDAERSESQVFDPIEITAGKKPYTNSVKDDGVDVLFGLYASVDATYAINDDWGIGCGVRYDLIVNDVKTDVADIDVSGLSFELKAVYSF